MHGQIPAVQSDDPLAQRLGARVLTGERKDPRILSSFHEAVNSNGTLTEVYGWFTEVFDAADLREASELLKSLS